MKALKLEGGGSVATTNVRQAYEKSLRCFELYMRSGLFTRDLEADTLPPAGQTFSRSQLIRIWGNARKGVPHYVTFKPYDLDANGEPLTVSAAAAAARAPAVVASPNRTARSIAAAAAAIAAGPQGTGAAPAAPAPGNAPASTVAPATAAAVVAPAPAPVRVTAQAAAPMPELKMVPQGPQPQPPGQHPQQLVDREVWREWEGHGWFQGHVTGWDDAAKVHVVAFAQGTPQQIEEKMNLLTPPVNISWRDPKRLVSATAAAITQAAQQQCAGPTRSARVSGSGGACLPGLSCN